MQYRAILTTDGDKQTARKVLNGNSVNDVH